MRLVVRAVGVCLELTVLPLCVCVVCRECDATVLPERDLGTPIQLRQLSADGHRRHCGMFRDETQSLSRPLLLVSKKKPERALSAC